MYTYMYIYIERETQRHREINYRNWFAMEAEETP